MQARQRARWFLVLLGAMLLAFGFAIGLKFALARFALETILPNLPPSARFLHFFFHIYIWTPLVLGIAVLAVGIVLLIPPGLRPLNARGLGNSLSLMGCCLLLFGGVNLILFVRDWWHQGPPRDVRGWQDFGLLTLLPWAHGSVVLALGRLLEAQAEEDGYGEREEER